MKVPHAIRYRKSLQNELAENWLTAMASELVFSTKIPEKFILMTLVLKSAIRFLLIFLIFQNDPQISAGTIIASICRNDYSSVCLLATSLSQKLYALWTLVSPPITAIFVLNFLAYLGVSFLVARTDPAIRRGSIPLGSVLEFFAWLFVTLCLVLGILGFFQVWVFVYTHQYPNVSFPGSDTTKTLGSVLNIVAATFSVVINLFVAGLGFSWRRFHLPMADKLLGGGDVLEYICDGLLLFGSNFIFESRVFLGVFSGLLVCFYTFRAKFEFPVAWQNNLRVDLANFGFLFLEGSFLLYLTFLGLTDANFQLPNPLLASVLFAVLAPMMWRFFVNLASFLEKNDHKILGNIWNSTAEPAEVSRLMLLTKLLARRRPGETILREQDELDELDLIVYSYIQVHAKDCRVSSCPCQKGPEGKKRSSRNVEPLLRAVVSERLRDFIARQSGYRVSRREFEAFLAYLDFGHTSYEATLFADYLHHVSSNTIQKIHWKMAFHAHKLRRAQKMIGSEVLEAPNGVDISQMLQREYQIKKIGKLIHEYFTEFLNLQKTASDKRMRLAPAKESLCRLYQIELRYFEFLDLIPTNDEIQFLDFFFRNFFRLPRITSATDGMTIIRNRLKDARVMSRLLLERDTDFQFLLMTIENRSTLQVMRTSNSIEKTLRCNKYALLKHSIDFLVPERLRAAHACALEEFFLTGNEKLIKHAPYTFIESPEGEPFPVILNTQLVLDWLGVKMLVFAKLRPTTKIKATMICDAFGSPLHVTHRLSRILGWPEHLEKFDFPFYLFLENGTEKFIDYLANLDSRQHLDLRARQKSLKSFSNFTDRLVADMDLVAKLRRTLRRQSVTKVTETPTPDQAIERVLANKFRFVRDKAGGYYSYPVRFSFRLTRFGNASFLFLNVLEDFALESRVAAPGQVNLFFRIVLLRIFLMLGVPGVAPERIDAIRKLFRSLIAKRQSAFRLHASVPPAEPPKLATLTGEETRIASKFHGYNDYDPFFLRWFKFLLFILGSAIFIVMTVAIIGYSWDVNFISGNVTSLFENAFMSTSLQFLTSVKLLEVCQTTNCTVAAQSIQKGTIDWSRGRSKTLVNSATLLSYRNNLDEDTALRPGLNSADLNFYSFLISSNNAILSTNASLPAKAQIIYENVQTMWTNFEARYLTPGLEDNIISSLNKFVFLIEVVCGLSGLFIFLLLSGYCLLKNELNFLIGMVQFFDLKHFSTLSLKKFSKSIKVVEFHPEKQTSHETEESLTDLRKVEEARTWQLFPLCRLVTIFLLLLSILVMIPLSLVQGLHLNTLSPFVVRNIIGRSVLFYSAKAHAILYPSSVIQIDDQSWARAINNLTDVIYFGEKQFPLANRTKLIGMLSSACQSTIPKNYPDCAKYFNGLLTQTFPAINSFLINYIKRTDGNFSLNSSLVHDSATVLTIAGLYLRELSVAVQSMGVEQLSGLTDSVLSLIGIVVVVGIVLVLAIYVLVLRPMRIYVEASMRIIHFLDHIRAFSNSQVRFFVDKLS